MLQHATSDTTRRPWKPQPIEAVTHPEAHLRLSTVLTLTGLGRSSWYRMVAENEAPQPMRFGQRCSRWKASDIQAFLARRAEQGGAA